MTTAPSTPPPPPSGYRSRDAKRRFTITVGILGAVFFVLQFVLPFALMFAIMPMMMFTIDLDEVAADRVVFWQDRLWTVKEHVTVTPSRKEEQQLVAFDPAEPVQADTVALPETREFRLLPDGDGLWLIAEHRVGRYADGRIEWTDLPRPTGDLTRPFLLDGRPAAIEFRPEGHSLVVFREGEWQEVSPLALGLREGLYAQADDLQALPRGEELDLFLGAGETVYWKSIAPGRPDDGKRWDPVRTFSFAWQAVRIDGRPAVFCLQGSPREIVGFRPLGENWERFVSERVGFGHDFSVCPAGGRRFFLLIEQGLSGLRILEVADGEVVHRAQRGGGSVFPKHFMAIAMMPHLFTFLMPLVLAFVLSMLMARHRVTRHESDEVKGLSAEYAPLWRRAAAQIVDLVVLGWPFLLAFAAMFMVFADFDTVVQPVPEEGFPFRFLMPHVFACGGFFWAIATLFFFAFLEGRYGATPGKWVLGIRVLGTDLRPCGFGRGLVRNLLKVVDGFFNFMVGVLLVALTENWQRVGDLAARTVVVMRSDEAPPPSGESPPPVPPS